MTQYALNKCYNLLLTDLSRSWYLPDRRFKTNTKLSHYTCQTYSCEVVRISVWKRKLRLREVEKPRLQQLSPQSSSLLYLESVHLVQEYTYHFTLPECPFPQLCHHLLLHNSSTVGSCWFNALLPSRSPPALPDTLGTSHWVIPSPYGRGSQRIGCECQGMR